jgi:hypothetical protein
MDITTWGLITSLTLIGLGVWNTTSRLNDLSFNAQMMKDITAKQEAVNSKQDSDIVELKNLISRQQGVLEEILVAVRRNGKANSSFTP